MLYNFIFSNIDALANINLFKYVSFRSMCALLTSLLMAFLIYPKFIKKFKYSQPIRLDGPEKHIANKQGTPTMGGAIIIISIIISSILWCDMKNHYISLLLGLTFSYAMIGLVDDYLKIKFNNSKGISGTQKLFFQIIIAIIFSLAVESIRDPSVAGYIAFPFLKNFIIKNTPILIVFTTLVIVGSSNAVNLTDGLDGLATFPSMMVALCLAIISYFVGHVVFANYLQISYIASAGEICVFCASIIGACLGFLWYNAPPAMIFMGDTGSLAIGAALGGISVIIKHEFVLTIIGGLFVIEAFSVILQVLSFKIFKKRIFLMAPIHHHFEKKGWNEATIVIRFWIISLVFAVIGLLTLKIR